MTYTNQDLKRSPVLASLFPNPNSQSPFPEPHLSHHEN